MGSSLPKIKKEALRLRKLGKSYNEIHNTLGVPKSTLSLWCQEIPKAFEIKKENISKAKLIWAQNITKYNKERAERARAQGIALQHAAQKEIFHITEDVLRILGAALYWAEGYRRTKWTPLFCNSDPAMIKLMMRFFREVCKVPEHLFRPQVQIHQNISKEEAERYWSGVSGLAKNQFRKPLLQISRQSKNKRPVRRLPYGTFRIGIADVKVLRKIKGWIEGIACQS